MGKKKLKIVQCDGRGQIVIPKEIRTLLDIETGAAFWIFPTNGKEIKLKKIDRPLIDDIE